MVGASADLTIPGMDLRKVVGANARAAREAMSLSQEEIAHRAQMHVTYLSGVENGKRNPTILILGRLAGALETSASKLLEPR
jgi:transcriptional regulator with XRE-family HTH domain